MKALLIGCRTLLAVGLAQAIVSPVAAQTVVPVYVFTAPADGGFEDPASKRRFDSLADLKDKLEDKKKTIRLVDAPELAAITLEVVGSAKVESGTVRTTTSRGLFGDFTSESAKTVQPTVNAVLKVGTYELPLTATNTLVIGGWKDAAQTIAVQVEKWIKANRSRLEVSPQ
jgi:hypothetical protein